MASLVTWCQQRTQQHWPEGIACLLRDPQLRQAMGQAGHSSVAERFSIQAAVCQYEALYLEQLALRTGTQRQMR